MRHLALALALPLLASSTRMDARPEGERHDSWAPSVRLGAKPVEVTREGYEVFEGTATIGDIVLDYPEHGTRELRPAEEVLSEAAVRSMVGKPITDRHPGRLITKDTTRPHVRGAVLSAERVDEDGKKPRMRVRVVVYDAELLDKIHQGVVELSPGYFFRLDRRPGAHEGQAYDGVQRGITYNHLAVLDRARTRTPDGDVARLDEESSSMETIEITLPDGTKHMVPAPVAAYMSQLMEELKAKASAADQQPAAPPAPAAAPAPAAPEQRADAAADTELAARIAQLEEQLKAERQRIDGLPAALRAEAVSYAELRRIAEPILTEAKADHRFDGDAFADKHAVAAVVFGAEDEDVKALAEAAGGKKARTPELQGRMDGLYKSAVAEHRRRRDTTGRQLAGLVVGKGQGERADAGGAQLLDAVVGLPGFPRAAAQA